MTRGPLHWRVIVAGHTADGGWIAPHRTVIVADDARAARCEAIRLAHLKAGVPTGNLADPGDRHACAIAVTSREGEGL